MNESEKADPVRELAREVAERDAELLRRLG